MKRIYVSGPYRAPSRTGRAANIQLARRTAEKVWRAGAVAICPHLNSAHFDGIVPDEVFLDGYLGMLETCHAVILTLGYADEISTGTRAEVEKAKRLGLPVFRYVEELEEWLGAES